MLLSIYSVTFSPDMPLKKHWIKHVQMNQEGCDYYENITIHAYRLTEQSVELYGKDGTLRATVTGRRHGEEVTFQVDGDAPGLRFEVCG